MVATQHPIKLSKIERWSSNEGMSDRYKVFVDRLVVEKRK